MEDRITNNEPRAIALAALYICESLLLELEEKKIVTGKDVEGLLKDAAKTLRGASDAGSDRDSLAASQIVEAISEQLERARPV